MAAIATLVILAGLVATRLVGAESTPDLDLTPRAARDALLRAAGSDPIMDVDRDTLADGTPVYEARIGTDAHARRVRVDSDGGSRPVGPARDPVAGLPAGVQAGIRRLAKGAAVTDADRTLGADGRVGYEIDLSTPRGSRRLRLDQQGEELR